MTSFIDGPATGQTLMLRNAPQFLRVVVNHAGEIDALDLPTDTPRPDEACFVYIRQGDAGRVHLHRPKAAGSGWFAMATYRFLEASRQPAQEQMVTAEAWAETLQQLELMIPL